MILYLSTMVTRSVIVLLLFMQVQTAWGQLPVTDQSLQQRYPWIRAVFNRIPAEPLLDSFYARLWQLRQQKKGQVSIVLIGDSHTQPGYQAEILRKAFQSYFGNAGRGLIFPYQAAQSNTPDDVRSNTAGSYWQFNRVAHPEINLPYGISGFGISSDQDSARVTVQLSNMAAGQQLQLFTDSLLQNQWFYRDSEINMVIPRDSLLSWKSEVVNVDHPISQFTLTGAGAGNRKSLYGILVKDTAAGVLVHTIGVNGARYDQYNNASLFWQQLPALEADLYIVSLGTNEAQARVFSESAFRKEVSTFLQKLKAASPGAAILLCTTPDSYKGKSSNRVLQQLNQALTRYYTEQHVALWDQYRITNGYGSAYSWIRRRLMNRDRVHYTAEGYRIMGQLLLSALARGYNSFTTLKQQGH